MEAMRHIVWREGQRRQSRFMPCPRQFGRWLWGVTEIECISLARLANASGPPLSFAKIPSRACRKSTYRRRRISHRRQSARARVKEGKVLTVLSNSRQCRQLPLTPRVASLPASEQPGGIFRLAGYMLGDDSERWSQGEEKQSPPAGWYGCLEAFLKPSLYWVRRSRAWAWIRIG